MYLSKDVTGALVLCPALSLALRLLGGSSISRRKPVVLLPCTLPRRVARAIAQIFNALNFPLQSSCFTLFDLGGFEFV